MNLHPNRFTRGLSLFTLLLGLISGLFLLTRVHAAPQEQTAMGLVISEFRANGPNGASDEFIEIYNPTNGSILIDGYKLKANNCAATNNGDIYQFASVVIDPHRHFLVAGSNYSGSVLPDISDSLGITEDGGIALTTDSDVVLDQVGMCPTTEFKEGTTLAPLINTPDQSYERRGGGCIDANNNAFDFLNIAPSSPQNSNSLPLPCQRVINITSTPVSVTYTTNADIDITVQFSSPVNVTGTPLLLLETGLVDGNAVYTSGSGTDTLTFTYTVKNGDASGSLDYVSSSSLTLNGGAITGAVGDVDLTLPAPGTPGSLAANTDIVIDDLAAPRVVSFMRQSPTVRITNTTTLVFRVTFSEPVVGVDSADFTVSGATGTSVVITTVSGNVYDIQVSGGDLPMFNGIVGLALSTTPTINDMGEPPSPVAVGIPGVNEDYLIDHISPTVTIEQSLGQADPASGPPVNFHVSFSESINVSTFTVSDIKQNGTISNSLINWNIVDSGDHKNFTLSAVAIAFVGTGTIIPSIDAEQVQDLAGNNNSASTSVDNLVTFADTTHPSVTVNRANSQASATNTLPINFSIVFSEPIHPSTFTPSKITQNGTATGITWVITDAGDHTNFTLSATVITGNGTLIPSISAGSVSDFAGNSNFASTSTDNVVTYDTTSPTVTVDQAASQADPASTLPIRFTVVFSEVIDTSTFAVADITQSGTVQGAVWTLTDSGDHKTFTLSVISLTTNGTLKPSIAAAKVTDLAGNNNKASTSTDNSVISSITLPTPTRTFTPAVTKTRTPTVTPTTTPTLTVVINEVAWMGTVANTADEWIELYGPQNANINGWQLIVRSTPGGTASATFTLSGSMNSQGYFILAPSNTFTDVEIDQNITTNLNNSGAVLELRNASGVLMDTANSDGSVWPAGVASPNYASMERHESDKLDNAANWYTFAGTPTKHDSDGNSVRGTPGYANWAVSVTATPTKSPTPTRTATRKPGSYVTPTPYGTMVINEFLPRAGFDWNQDGKINVYDEFIEIANLGPINVTLTGWKLDDEAGSGSSPYSLPNVTLTPGQHLVIYASQSNVLLSDGGDTVRLLNPNNKIIDAQTYSVVKVEDKSWCRLPDINGSWYSDCFPTPNQRNTRDGTVPSTPPGTGLEEQRCTLPDTLPEDFRSAECFGFGSNMWQPMYWDVTGWLKDFLVPQNESKWETYIE